MNRIGPAGFLLYVAAAVVLSVALGFLLSGRPPYSGFYTLLFLGAIPRLHDIGRSGWWFLIAMLFTPAAIMLFESGELLLAALATLPVAAMVAALAIIPGEGTNRYGPPPVR